MTNNDIDFVKCWWFYCEHAKQVVCCNKCCKVLKPETGNISKEETRALFKSCMDTISEDDVRRVECTFGKPIIKKDDAECQE